MENNGKGEETTHVKSTESIMSGLFWKERTDKESGREVGGERKEQVAVRIFETDAARVTMSGSATINMGNYQSTRVDVGLSVPCYLEEMPEVYEKVKATIEHHLQREVADLIKQREKGGF